MIRNAGVGTLVPCNREAGVPFKQSPGDAASVMSFQSSGRPTLVLKCTNSSSHTAETNTNDTVVHSGPILGK